MGLDENSFREALSTAKIPVLVLDQKWHRLFAISGKPDDVKQLEEELNELLARQGKLNNELKELKKVKMSLMSNIVSNMDEKNNKVMDDNSRLINETNEKIASDEDELLDIPKLIKEKDHELMMATMVFCYGKLRSNSEEINEISDWITNVRVELKKNIIKKQNREINNKEIYSYMHDIFGKNVMNLFDVADSENLINKVANDEKKNNDNSGKSGVKEISYDSSKIDEHKKKEDFKADTKKG